MLELKEKLIRRAFDAHKSISPCAHRAHLEECFTVMGDKLVFWFNTEDHSTHVLIEEISVEGQHSGWGFAS